MADKLDRNLPRTEDSKERGLVKDTGKNKDVVDPSTYKDFGKSDALDADESGDIADEGPGHRG